MSDAITLVRQVYEAINAHDSGRAEALLHPEFTHAGPGGEVDVRGPHGMAAFIEGYLTAFPDLNDGVRHLHVAGDNIVVTEVLVEGTHNGDLMGIAPTGRRIALPACNVWEVRDGKVFSEREYYDPSIMMQQLGVVPAPPTPS